MGYYSATKMKQCHFAAMWMDPEMITQSVII